MKTTTTIYPLLMTQFWQNFKVRLLWPKIITTATTATTTTTTTSLGFDWIELNLVYFLGAEISGSCPNIPECHMDGLKCICGLYDQWP